MAAKFLSTEEVSAETGATLRQLQWWDERGIMRPTGKVGKDRRYSPAQVKLAELLVRFRYFGIPPRRALRYIEQSAFCGVTPNGILTRLSDLQMCGLRMR